VYLLDELERCDVWMSIRYINIVESGLDFILLLNHATTEESGLMLGEGILRYFKNVYENAMMIELNFGTKPEVKRKAFDTLRK
jgi:hypothetical protein